MTFKVIIAGSRHFSDFDHLAAACDFFLSNVEHSIEIVSGGAKGADSLGERYAAERGYELKRFPANWKKFGRNAGPIRNGEMASYADAVIAFPKGTSVGTANMLKQARKARLKIRVGSHVTPERLAVMAVPPHVDGITPLHHQTETQA